MKQLLLLLAIIVLIHPPVAAQTTTLSPVATLLFRNIKSKLSVAQKNEIAKNLGFILSGNKAEPFALDKDSKEFPFRAFVYPVDMNKDGKEEIFISFGNTFTSGHTGSSIILYVPDVAGKYAANLSFPGMTPDMLPTMNKGYNDLLIGGPGFEFPIWRWNGKEYVYHKTIKENEYQKLKLTNVAEVSKRYQDSLK